MSVLCRSLCSTCLRLRHTRHYAMVSFGPASLPPDSSRLTHQSRGLNQTRESGLSLTQESRKNLLQETKLEKYLDHIASTSHQVILADIERYRPSRHAAPKTSEYEQEYNTLLEILVHSFTSNQLRQFLNLYHLDFPAKFNKRYLAATIIERGWNWPSLTNIKKERRDWTEMVLKSFPLDARQSFLLLGKDGVDLLTLSSEYNVHVSFSSNPLSLQVQGLRGSINNLSRYIDDFKHSIKEEVFSLPPGRSIGLDTLQRISRFSGVFTENLGNSIRLSYRSTEDRGAHLAKRLAMQAAFKVTYDVPTLVLNASQTLPTCLMPEHPCDVYSFYPFPHPRSLPLVMDTGSFFRIRRIGEHFRSNLDENTQKAVGLANSSNAVTNIFGEQVPLRDMLFRQISSLSDCTGSQTTITASFGHLLACSEFSQQPSFKAPLKGRQTLSEVMDWLKDCTNKQLFVPSLPISMLDSLPTQQRLIRRLVYHCHHDFENTSQPIKTLVFEINLKLFPTSVGDQTYDNFFDQPHPSDSGGELGKSFSKNIVFEPTCCIGSLQEFNLMMPDHLMDIRFYVANTSTLSQENWPEGLKDYFTELHSFLSCADQGMLQPCAPLALKYQGITYGLQSSSTVRQISELVTKPASGTTTASGIDNHQMHVISENIFDLESNQASTVCQVTCNDITSDDSLMSFFKHCDNFIMPK